MSESVEQITQKIEKEFPVVAAVSEEVGKILVGQKNMTEKLLIGFLSDGHKF